MLRIAYHLLIEVYDEYRHKVSREYRNDKGRRCLNKKAVILRESTVGLFSQGIVKAVLNIQHLRSWTLSNDGRSFIAQRGNCASRVCNCGHIRFRICSGQRRDSGTSVHRRFSVMYTPVVPRYLTSVLTSFRIWQVVQAALITAIEKSERPYVPSNWL